MPRRQRPLSVAALDGADRLEGPSPGWEVGEQVAQLSLGEVCVVPPCGQQRAQLGIGYQRPGSLAILAGGWLGSGHQADSSGGGTTRVAMTPVMVVGWQYTPLGQPILKQTW